ncbi:MAG TPA: hypothetical protein VIT92_02925 [Burkholderiaceae bacterium]
MAYAPIQQQKHFSSVYATLAAFCCALLFAGNAWAAQGYERVIPPEAKKGEFTISQYPSAVLNGKTRRLSVAARIRNADNLIVMPAVLGDSRYIVKYTEDFQGEIDRVWILSSEEAARREPGVRDLVGPVPLR